MVVQIGNYETFKKAISSGVVLVDFYADRCGPCKVLGPIIHEVGEETKSAAVLKVDIDAIPQAAEDFNVMSIPTVIVFRDGEVVGEAMVGVREKQDYLNAIQQAVSIGDSD